MIYNFVQRSYKTIEIFFVKEKFVTLVAKTILPTSTFRDGNEEIFTTGFLHVKEIGPALACAHSFGKHAFFFETVAAAITITAALAETTTAATAFAETTAITLASTVAETTTAITTTATFAETAAITIATSVPISATVAVPVPIFIVSPLKIPVFHLSICFVKK
jgi:hypothetical protein